MNPKQFLQIGGVVLVIVGILGFIGVIGPTAERSIFGSLWWFDQAENWAHLVIGIVALVAAYVLPANSQKGLVVVLGVVGVLVGLWSLFGYQNLLGANLENPLDSLLHLAIGAWALWAAWRRAPQMAPPMGGM